mmetsp:Transcript_61609/g.139462  ORF Transcript_61609/g.139462 Transcript_61609/m.139462 type:complete len:359 (+) Transcript_61609:136-1212(+)
MPKWTLKRGDRSMMLVTRVIPVLFNTISYQVTYAAMASFSLSACQMNVLVKIPGRASFQVNASMLNAADCVAIIVTVPLLDSLVYPAADRLLGRRTRASEKYLAGLGVCCAAVALAAWFEVSRRASPPVPGCALLRAQAAAQAGAQAEAAAAAGAAAGASVAPTPSPSLESSLGHEESPSGPFASQLECYSNCASSGVEMSDFSVWWMALPFSLVGVGECLCNIPIYECCYSQTPPAYRSMANAVFLFTTAVGSMLTGAFTTALRRFITDDLNDGHLEYFYGACLAFVVLLVPVNLACFSRFEELDEREVEAAGCAKDHGEARKNDVNHVQSSVSEIEEIEAVGFAVVNRGEAEEALE